MFSITKAKSDLKKNSIPLKFHVGTAFKRYRQQDGKCFLCGKPLDETTNIDHIYPSSKGGANNWGNKVLTHRQCNLEKKAKIPSIYMLRKLMRLTGVKWPKPLISKQLERRKSKDGSGKVKELVND